MPDKDTTDLISAQDEFIRVWGQMASAWGISRTMAEVHALLYITGAELCADDVMERLAISRGNASISLRALLDWGVIRRAHKKGDRKDYFVAEQDVWTMFRAIVRGRLKREVEPLVASLYELRDLTLRDKPSDDDARLHAQRLDALLEFFQMLGALAARFAGPSGEGLRAAASLLYENTEKDDA